MCLLALLRQLPSQLRLSSPEAEQRAARGLNAGANGPQSVKIARSNRNAQPGQSGGLLGGRRETVEHRFGTIKASIGATHFLSRTLPKVAADTLSPRLHQTRVMDTVGIKPLIPALT